MSFSARFETCGENFYERYYSYYRRHGIARVIGRKACHEILSLDERLDAEIESTIVESLNGRVASEYSFDVVDGYLVAADGEKIQTLLDRALHVAHAMSLEDLYYSQFLPERTKNELDELLTVQELITNSHQPTAICVFSPYSEEYDLYDGKLDKAFQRPDCQRAMLRITFWDGNKAHIITRSLDYASVELILKTANDALNHTFTSANSTAIQGELLKIDVRSLDDVRLIADRIVSAFDENKYKETGVKTVQGRSIYEDADLQLAVGEKCGPIKESLKKELKKAARYAMHAGDFKRQADAMLYNHIALADSTIKGHVLDGDISGDAYAAGLEASRDGTSYNACGVILDGGNPNSMLSASTGYESLMLLSKKLIACPNCHTKVIVEDTLLKEGILHCGDCGNTVDVCGDKAKEKRYKELLAKKLKKHKKPQIQRRSLFDILFGSDDKTINKR